MTCSPFKSFAIVLLVSKRIHRFWTSKKESVLCATPPILLFIALFIILLLSTQVGFCMPMDNPGVDLGMIEIYRPLIARLPSESNWIPLFEHFEELGGVIQTTRRGQLLRPEETYELIQQLYPMQLGLLLDSVLITFGPNVPEITEQCAVISRQLVISNHMLLITLEQIAHTLSLVRGIDVSNQLLDENFLALGSLRGLNIFPGAERYYATEILLRSEDLYLHYSRLFTLLQR